MPLAADPSLMSDAGKLSVMVPDVPAGDGSGNGDVTGALAVPAAPLWMCAALTLLFKPVKVTTKSTFVPLTVNVAVPLAVDPVAGGTSFVGVMFATYVFALVLDDPPQASAAATAMRLILRMVSPRDRGSASRKTAQTVAKFTPRCGARQVSNGFAWD